MKGFLDPVKNARVIGILFIINGILTIPGLLGTWAFFGINLYVILSALTVVLCFTIGIGLLKKKLRAIYAMGTVAALSIIAYFITKDPNTLIFSAIEVLLFIRFWSAKDKFTGKSKDTVKNEMIDEQVQQQQ